MNVQHEQTIVELSLAEILMAFWAGDSDNAVADYIYGELRGCGVSYNDAVKLANEFIFIMLSAEWTDKANYNINKRKVGFAYIRLVA